MPRIRSEPTAAHANNNHAGAAAVLDAPPPPKPPEGPPAKAVVIVERRIEKASITIPLGEPDGYESKRLAIDEGALTDKQSAALARLFHGLRDSRATLANGRPIGRWSESLRWLLEQIADA